MKRFLGPILVLVIAALGAHWATLAYAPSIIMDRALVTLKDRGIALHAFTTPARISPQTQTVVRSSPDMFYSLCRYDLSDAETVLDVTMAQWPGYQSLSFFDGNTNNFATYRKSGENFDIRLFGPGKKGAGIATPTDRGVILIRRLAPTQELFDAAVEASKNDRCELLTS